MLTPAHLAQGIDPQAVLRSNAFVSVPLQIWVKLIDQLHHVKITDENTHTWPSESPFTRPLNLRLDPNNTEGAKPGDIIWLAQRKKIAEVGSSAPV